MSCTVCFKGKGLTLVISVWAWGWGGRVSIPCFWFLVSIWIETLTLPTTSKKKKKRREKRKIGSNIGDLTRGPSKEKAIIKPERDVRLSRKEREKDYLGDRKCLDRYQATEWEGTYHCLTGLGFDWDRIGCWWSVRLCFGGGGKNPAFLVIWKKKSAWFDICL